MAAAFAGLDPGVRFALARGARLESDDRRLDPHAVIPLRGAEPQITLTVDRPEDLFQAEFTFYGFTVDTTSTPRALTATAPEIANTWIGVVVKLPPQAIAEGDYASPNTPFPFDPTPVLSAISGPSALAFSFATGETIPLPNMDASDLLDWSGWTLSVQPTAVAGSESSDIRPPNAFETQIEAPYGLILAPVVPDASVLRFPPFATGFQTKAPVTNPVDEVTECWSAGLVGHSNFILFGGGDTAPYVPTVAAVWARDYTGSDLTPWTNIVYEAYTVIQ